MLGPVVRIVHFLTWQNPGSSQIRTDFLLNRQTGRWDSLPGTVQPRESHALCDWSAFLSNSQVSLRQDFSLSHSHTDSVYKNPKSIYVLMASESLEAWSSQFYGNEANSVCWSGPWDTFKSSEQTRGPLFEIVNCCFKVRSQMNRPT